MIVFSFNCMPMCNRDSLRFKHMASYILKVLRLLDHVAYLAHLIHVEKLKPLLLGLLVMVTTKNLLKSHRVFPKKKRFK